MKLRSSCTALASALSAKYATYHEYQTGENLNNYFDDNGLLVSMCNNWDLMKFQYSCELKKRDRVLSASWIQKNQTGFRAFYLPQLPAAVGMVVDPTYSQLEVQCLFPADGMTAQRDDLVVNTSSEGSIAKACGPVIWDPRFGSKGFDQLPKWRQILEREAWNAYAQRNFQNNHNVSCLDFFFQDEDGPRHVETMIYLKEVNEEICSNDPEFTYRDYIQLQADDLEYKVGHKLCQQDSNNHTNKFHRINWFIYAGRCSWLPHEFNKMLAVMQKLDRQHAVVQNWNEVVLDKPDVLADAVQAVFFVQYPKMDNFDDQYRNAIRQAKKLGKHLFKMHWNDSKPLFTCNVSASELSLVEDA